LEWISEQTGRKVISEEEVTKRDEELTAQDEDAYCYINKVQVVSPIKIDYI
jgi:DNA-directed RNA polymerase subunit F